MYGLNFMIVAFMLYFLISGNISQAIYQCDECSQDMCLECYDLHKKSAKTGKHKLVKIDRAKRNKIKTGKAREGCDNHAGQFVESYCPVHKVLVCRVCVSTSHKQCEGVETIESISSGIRARADVSSLNAELDKLTGRFEKVLNEKQMKLENIKQQGRHLEGEVHKFQDMILKLLDKAVKTIMAEKNKLCEKESNELEHNITTCTNVIPVLLKAKGRLDSTAKSASENDLFITVCRLTDEANTYDAIAKKVEETSKAVKFDFKMNNTLPNILKGKDGIGQIDVTTQELNLLKLSDKKFQQLKSPALANGINPTVSIRKASASTKSSITKTIPGRKPSRASSIVTSVKPTPLPPLLSDTSVNNQTNSTSLLHIGKLDVSMKSDKVTCFISSMTYLPNGRLCIVDSRNSKIKMYGSDRKLLSSLASTGMPHDITKVSDNEVAVTIPSSQKVVLIKVEKKLKLTNTMSIEGDCYGIAFNEKNGKLYVGTGRDLDTCIQVYSIDGTLLKTIRAKNAVLNFPQYMVFNNTWSKLYVSDQDAGIVIVNMNDRGIVNQPHIPDIDKYLGMTRDKNGNVYVLTNKPDALQKVQPSARSLDIKTSLKDGPPPLAVSYGEKGGIMIISFTGSNILQLFKFSG